MATLPAFAQLGTPSSPSVATAISAASLNNKNASLAFPGDIQNMAYYTTLKFEKYSRSRPESGKTTTTSATIILPIPDSFGDQHHVGWNGAELGLWGSSLEDAKKGRDGLMQAGTSIFEQLKLGTWDGAGAGAGAAIAAAGLLATALAPSNMRDGQIQNRIRQELGAVANPHLTAIFEGMPLRNHQLSWTFSPRTEQEAKTLGQIISKIRMLSLPSYNKTVSKFALDYPDTCTVTFEGVDADFKTKIFKSAVVDFQANLNSAQGPAFNPNGRPSVVSMAISLMETEIVTREDFGGASS